MTSIPHLVGMVHLAPLPGSPRFGGSMDKVAALALEDAGKLVGAGFPALLVENFGDIPFFADSVPPETIAAMTHLVGLMTNEVGVPIGVNVLRNDALSAIAIATVTDAPMIRVNVLTGTMYTDQGPIVGRAAALLRRRKNLGCEAEIWADVFVKHATPPYGLDVGQAGLDTLQRGMADALIISGSGTGASPDLDRLKHVRETVGSEARIVIGSGVHHTNLEMLAEHANSFIVGSSTKTDGIAANPVDPARASKIVGEAQRAGILR